jgi:hypothetical protein
MDNHSGTPYITQTVYNRPLCNATCELKRLFDPQGIENSGEKPGSDLRI